MKKFRKRIDNVKKLRKEAQEKQKKAAEATRILVGKMRLAKFKLREIAKELGLTEQRIHSISKPSEMTGIKLKKK